MPKAEEYTHKPITVLPFSKFRLFNDTGSRIEYENDYFDRRRRLDVMFGMVMAGQTEYLTHLEDIICSICSEYTWALPAHIEFNSVSPVSKSQKMRCRAEPAQYKKL